MVVVLAVVAAGCSSSGSKGASPSTSPTSSTAPKPTDGPPVTTNPAPTPITILVTNDDGYSAPGIDTMVEALRALPMVTLTVVAPLVNRSGTGGKTTNGVLKAQKLKTASGYPA